jgi:NlpC/P60 family
MAPVKNTVQLEGMGDVSLEHFTLQMRNKAGIELVESIVDATLERTIEGASTLTVVVDDDLHRPIQLSGKLGRHISVEVDGLWFVLVSVRKTGRQLTLTFEDRVVNALRYFDTWIHVSRGTMTRAQFVLAMILEARQAGVDIHYVIPELNAKQAVSDLQPGQTEIGPDGNPITSKSPQVRPPGIPQGVPLAPTHGLTSKGAAATSSQVGIADTVIATGLSQGARRKVLVTAIMTAIQESNLTNLSGGDRDSVGVFQQRASMGWAASRNVETDAADFYTHAIAEDKKYPNLSYNDLAQKVQGSGYPHAYAQHQPEAEKFVNEYGVTGAGPGGTGDVAANPAYANNQQPAQGVTGGAGFVPSGNVIGSGDYQFYRGTLTQDPAAMGNWLLTKENSWNCMKRLAGEVNWRAFCVSGFIYFVSDQYLFRSKPFMTISEDSEGIDWIDYDYDEGKRVATITVTCHIKLWSAPPGSIVQIVNMGIPNGRWLVNDVSRSIFGEIGTIMLKKPLPILPEATAQSQAKQFPGASVPVPQPNMPLPGQNVPGPQKGDAVAPNVCAANAVKYAYAQLGDPYVWGAEGPDSFDCSGLVQAAYSACASYLPRVADDQWHAGPRPLDGLKAGDLVFFSEDIGGSVAGHVGIYIGNGQFIHAPHTGDVVKISNLDSDWYKPRFLGNTRPSTK